VRTCRDVREAGRAAVFQRHVRVAQRLCKAREHVRAPLLDIAAVHCGAARGRAERGLQEGGVWQREVDGHLRAVLPGRLRQARGAARVLRLAGLAVLRQEPDLQRAMLQTRCRMCREGKSGLLLAPNCLQTGERICNHVPPWHDNQCSFGIQSIAERTPRSA
jgi:hypothetical protein